MFQCGTDLLPRRLTKLYSDTKQSYASANVTPAAANTNENPELQTIRRDYQIQQDRLLAWGHNWTETNASEAQRYASGDVEIDKKLDQAGLGEVVADVMSEIQRLLNESGNLQRPDRYLQASKPRSQISPRVRTDWTTRDIKTAKSLLEQLTTSIDVLYNLSESRRTTSQTSKDGPRSKQDNKFAVSEPSRPTVNEIRPVTSAGLRTLRLENEETEFLTKLEQDSLFIPYEEFSFKTLQDDEGAPPPYEEAKLQLEHRCVALYKAHQINVLLSFLSLSQLRGERNKAVNNFSAFVRAMRHKLQSLAGQIVVTYGAHLPSPTPQLELIGFTTDKEYSRVALVFSHPPFLSIPQQQKSLAEILHASLNPTEPSTPPLETRFRFAYNLVLMLLNYYKDQPIRASPNSVNLLYIFRHGEDVRPRYWKGLKNPYFMAPMGRLVAADHLQSMYRHPSDDGDLYGPPAFDIYSIGLVLLEIGLWIPISKFWKPKYDRTAFMTKIKTAYVPNLASKCGSRYLRAVQTCLRAPENGQHNERAFTQATSILIEVAQELRMCCFLDEDGPPLLSDLQAFQSDDSGIDVHDVTVEGGEPYDEPDTSMLDAPPTPMSLPDENEVSPSRQPVDISPSEQPLSNDEPALRKFSDLDIPQADLDDWNTKLMPRLSKLLQTTLADSSESCSVSLMMIGATPSSAKSTICIQCQDTARVEQAVRKGFRPKKGWGVVILRGQIRRSGRRRRRQPRKRQQQAEQAAMEESGTKLREQYYQERPSCGASIGAFKDGEHLPPVSFGGTILVDGEAYGMTVHHMLDDVSDAEDEDVAIPHRSSASRGEAMDNLRKPGMADEFSFMQITDRDIDDQTPYPDRLELDEDADSDLDSDTSTIRPDYSAFDEDGNEFWFLGDAPDLEDDSGSSSSDSEEGEDEDTESIGDVAGVDPSDDDELHITQPAIDDVEDDFFPSEHDRDDDHLDSHAFGYVHASSGIRRITHPIGSTRLKHEVDWALIRVTEHRLNVSNVIASVEQAGNRTHRNRSSRKKSKSAASKGQNDDQDSTPTLAGITPLTSLSGTPVHCHGRSSGFKSGRISQALALVKFHGRQSFSSSWCVEGGFGVPGDSGAWVYDPETKKVCGHVLAWAEKSKTAYIAPMEVLFEDIRRTLGAETVQVAGAGAEIRIGEKKKPQQLQPESESESVHKDPVTPEAGNAQVQSPSESEKLKDKPKSPNDQLSTAKDIELALRDIDLHNNDDDDEDQHTHEQFGGEEGEEDKVKSLGAWTRKRSRTTGSPGPPARTNDRAFFLQGLERMGESTSTSRRSFLPGGGRFEARAVGVGVGVGS